MDRNNRGDLDMLLNYFMGGILLYQVTAGLLFCTALALPEEHRITIAEIMRYCSAIVALNLIVMLLNHRFVRFEDWTTALQVPLVLSAIIIYAASILSLDWRRTILLTIWSYLITGVSAQVLSAIIIIFRIQYIVWKPGVYMMIPVEIAAAALIIWGIRKWLVLELTRDGAYIFNIQKMILVIAVGTFYCLFTNYQFLFWLMGHEPESASRMITVFRFIIGVFCILILIIQNSAESRQRAEFERDFMQQLWYQQQDQYRVSKENIDLINRKCHDIKYQIAALKSIGSSKEINDQIEEMKHSIMIYDSAVKTGNRVLDTILMEKSLLCEKYHINLTCMADGSILSFINHVDLYSMCGNALDNAIESVMKQPDIEKRVIQMSAFREKEMAVIRIRNYCDEDLQFEDGLPLTTKTDRKGYHGYGIRSIRHVAEQYGGGMNCRINDHSFVMQIMIPVQSGVN
jgi:hypothetical protein